MAGFFKKIYDYLLRLFWYVFVHTAAMSSSSQPGWLFSGLCDWMLGASLIDLILQGDRDGYHHDRTAKCGQDIAASRPSCKPPFHNLLIASPIPVLCTQDHVSDHPANLSFFQGGEFTIE